MIIETLIMFPPICISKGIEYHRGRIQRRSKPLPSRRCDSLPLAKRFLLVPAMWVYCSKEERRSAHEVKGQRNHKHAWGGYDSRVLTMVFIMINMARDCAYVIACIKHVKAHIWLLTVSLICCHTIACGTKAFVSMVRVLMLMIMVTMV